jgi:hypothetical protein
VTIAYIDTSFYLNILLKEKGSSKHREILKDKTLVSSILLPLESQRALLRLAREKGVTEKMHRTLSEKMKEDWETFKLMDFDLNMATSNEFPLLRLPRSLDLIHLRTALRFRKIDNLQIFLTLDENQKACALELGFETECLNK